MVIDAEGRVVYDSTGAIPDGEKKVAEAVRKALGVPSPEAVEGGSKVEDSGAAPGEKLGSGPESREES
jgi:hypothetical protein